MDGREVSTLDQDRCDAVECVYVEEGTAVHRHDSHPGGRVVDLVVPNAIRMERSSVRIRGAAPKYGAHTCLLLREVGFGGEEISRLLADGSVSEAWAHRDDYLPD